MSLCAVRKKRLGGGTVQVHDIIEIKFSSQYISFCTVFLSLKTLSCWATVTANQCRASTTHAAYYSVYSLLWKSPFLGKVQTQA